MSALIEEKTISNDIKLVYDLVKKPNRTNLKPKIDRAVIAKMRLDLILPANDILTVDIDFDTTSGYHGNAMILTDDFGVEMAATAFEVKYSKEFANALRNAWLNKQNKDAPRKPSYILVQHPKKEGELPRVFAACGDRDHKPDTPTDPIPSYAPRPTPPPAITEG
ncbi:hypothetical protein SG34_008250 [Thalassomonas viridans]|uniref:Uncharacterized protein n=1 Tax=Thalassomonas viridans TaxID=137584 RepID=A0AAE9Z5Y3_9GAMM|nr:hypothetical protein [Thalassomonas viridans]WDE06877.1 hypothetical protein SG34_008250 [Thalassomonas viridans]